MIDPERLEELRRLALASDVEITTDSGELTRRSVKGHMRSVAMDNMCGTVGRIGAACTKPSGHEPPHSWAGMSESPLLSDGDRSAISGATVTYRRAMEVIAFAAWRVGRTNPCNVYGVTGVADNWKDDTPIATFATPELAIKACEDHNWRLR